MYVGCNLGIIYWNVKLVNILFLKKMVVKVVDFGFVEFMGEKDLKFWGYSVDLMGIIGYFDFE